MLESRPQFVGIWAVASTDVVYCAKFAVVLLVIGEEPLEEDAWGRRPASNIVVPECLILGEDGIFRIEWYRGGHFFKRRVHPSNSGLRPLKRFLFVRAMPTVECYTASNLSRIRWSGP